MRFFVERKVKPFNTIPDSIICHQQSACAKRTG
jgi:hypothetical protein